MDAKRKLLIGTLFLAFIFLRLFVDVPIRLTADNMKFLELANNFPRHTLYNGQIYLQHPIAYPYFIHFTNFFMDEDHIAAIMLSLISAAIAFFIIFRFTIELTGNFRVSFLTMVFVTLSVELITASYKPARESFMLMTIYSSLYFYLMAIKKKSAKYTFLASLSAIIAALTSDHAIFLIPSFLLTYLFFAQKTFRKSRLHLPNIKHAIIPAALLIIVYSSWLGIKIHTYSNNDYYPAGLEGTPLKTKNFGFMELFNPTYFDDYESETGIRKGLLSRIKNYAYNFGYMFNMEPFSIPRGLNLSTMKFLLNTKHIFFMLLIYLPLALVFLYGIFKIIKEALKAGKFYTNAYLYLILIFLVFLFPITQKVTSPRYILPAYIISYIILSYAILELVKKSQFLNAKSGTLLLLFFLFLMPYRSLTHDLLVISSKKLAAGKNTAEYISNNIEKYGNIMAQPGYVVSMIYLTDNKAIGMPPNKEDFLKAVKIYDIDYIIFGRFYTYDNYHYSIKTIEFIKNNPDKFLLLTSVKEDYGMFFNEEDKARNDEIYIYKVVKSRL